MKSAPNSVPNGAAEEVCQTNTLRSDYQEYLKSDWWKNLRTNILEFRTSCEKCSIPRWLAKIAYGQDLNIHHESYAHMGTYDEVADLVVLCRRCHDIETFGSSDLRNPPSNKCKICKEIHWNPWSDRCDVCCRIAKLMGWEYLQSRDIKKFVPNDLVGGLFDPKLRKNIHVGPNV